MGNVCVFKVYKEIVSTWTFKHSSYQFMNELIEYCLTSNSQMLHSFGDAIVSDEGLQNVGICSALIAGVVRW